MGELPESLSEEPFLRGMLESSEHILFRLDFVRGGYDYISSIAASLFAVSLESLYERGLSVLFDDLCHPDDVERFREHILSLCRNSPGQLIRTVLEFRLRDAKGAMVWLNNSMTIVSNEKGWPLVATGIAIDVTARRYYESALRESEEKYRVTMGAVQAGIFILQDMKFRFVNPKLCAMFGFREDECIDKMGPLDLVSPEQREMVAEWMARCTAGDCGEPYKVVGARKDGSGFPLMMLGESSRLDDRPASVGTLVDLSSQRQAEESLKLSARVFENAQESIILTDAKFNIVSVNPAFLEMTGYEAEEVLGKNPRLLSSGRHSTEFYVAMWQTINTEDKWQGEIWNCRKNGDVFPVWVRISVYRDAAGKACNYVGIATDISERLAAQESIRQLAYFDPLTQLPNRRMLQDRVGQALASAEREGKLSALLFIDLDQFKTINDSLGHSAGDQLLIEVAKRLLGCVRRMDTVARLGGDEYVVLLTDVTLEGTSEVARKILDVVALPFQFNEHELGVTPSLGISVFPQDGRDFETLLKHADTAMYRAKDSGRNAYQFFTREMNAAALERLMLENSLRQGLERGEFILYYQPQINVASGLIVGAEALVRWRHPKIGLVPPGKFIPAAETSGLIVSIGEWVLRESCRQNRAWQDAGLPLISVAVNISSVQFRGGQLEENVRSVLADTGMPAKFLELELTEGILMGGANETVETLKRLSEMGVKLAIDDFGTGYSSLSYLKRFPIDKLKIDQSFVRDIVSDPDDWAIANAVISMGHSLRMSVIAEGVEHAEQLEILRNEGCDEVQGYHFSVPLPAGEFAELLCQQRVFKKGLKMQQIVIGIGGMSCQGCVKNITGVLQALHGVDRVDVSLEAGQASVTFEPEKVNAPQFKKAIEDAGFDVL